MVQWYQPSGRLGKAPLTSGGFRPRAPSTDTCPRDQKEAAIKPLGSRGVEEESRRSTFMPRESTLALRKKNRSGVSDWIPTMSGQLSLSSQSFGGYEKRRRLPEEGATRALMCKTAHGDDYAIMRSCSRRVKRPLRGRAVWQNCRAGMFKRWRGGWVVADGNTTLGR